MERNEAKGTAHKMSVRGSGATSGTPDRRNTWVSFGKGSFPSTSAPPRAGLGGNDGLEGAAACPAALSGSEGASAGPPIRDAAETDDPAPADGTPHPREEKEPGAANPTGTAGRNSKHPASSTHIGVCRHCPRRRIPCRGCSKGAPDRFEDRNRDGLACKERGSRVLGLTPPGGPSMGPQAPVCYDPRGFGSLPDVRDPRKDPGLPSTGAEAASPAGTLGPVPPCAAQEPTR